MPRPQFNDTLRLRAGRFALREILILSKLGSSPDSRHKQMLHSALRDLPCNLQGQRNARHCSQLSFNRCKQESFAQNESLNRFASPYTDPIIVYINVNIRKKE